MVSDAGISVILRKWLYRIVLRKRKARERNARLAAQTKYKIACIGLWASFDVKPTGKRAKGYIKT